MQKYLPHRMAKTDYSPNWGCTKIGLAPIVEPGDLAFKGAAFITWGLLTLGLYHHLQMKHRAAMRVDWTKRSLWPFKETTSGPLPLHTS